MDVRGGLILIAPDRRVAVDRHHRRTVHLELLRLTFSVDAIRRNEWMGGWVRGRVASHCLGNSEHNTNRHKWLDGGEADIAHQEQSRHNLC